MQKIKCSIYFELTTFLIFSFVVLAQEATFSPGPLSIPLAGTANGGFAWADMNGDGYLDLFIPPSNLIINNGVSFSQNNSATFNIPFNANSVGLALVDFNGDGIPDLMTSNGGNPAAGLYYNYGGVLMPATGIGDLSTVPPYRQLFQGIAIAPIEHSNYLSIVIPHNYSSDTLVFPPGLGMVILRGESGGFTNVGVNATTGNLAIDISKSFEMWDPRFFDANNDGWMDLLIPSFRHGYRRDALGPDSAGARKGSIFFLNDGTGKFKIPTSASVGRTLYTYDSLSFTVAFTIGRAVDDTGIVVDDTVRHFNAIGCQVGDLNNDGNIDIIFTGTEANNWDGMGRHRNTVLIYGKGDGTYTYHWDGITTDDNGLINAGNTRAYGIGDYNNDGWQDVYISQTFGAQFMFRNNGDGTFTDVSSQVTLTGGGHRSGDFIDYNNDGFLDIYQHGGSSSVIQKNNGNGNNWIGFIPTGTGNNKMAIGARFTVWSGSDKQIRDIRASGGASGGGHEVRALFGLGTGTMDSVIVQWPDGNVQRWSRSELSANGGATVENKYWTIQQGATIPPAPNTISPKWNSGDTTLNSTLSLKWNSVTGGTGKIRYQVQVTTKNDFSTIVKNESNITDSSSTAKLSFSTKYYWRVRSFSAGLTGVWSDIDSFKTKFIPCDSIPKLLLPETNQLTVPKHPVLKVSYVPEASTYHIQVDSVNRFTTQFVLNDSVNILDTIFIMNPLIPGKKYYWRVRGWNTAGISQWSPVDSFTIMYLPTAPVLVYPTINQADVVPVSVTFKWNKVAGDSNYVLKFWTNLSDHVEMFTDTTEHDTTFTVTNLRHRFRYYWQVKAFNQGGMGQFSMIDSFTTSIEKPGAPVTVSPKSITNVNRRTRFTWRVVPTAVKYHLQVATNNFPTVNITVDIFVEDTTVIISDTLKMCTTYYWHVSGVNAGGEGNFSGSAFFVTFCSDFPDFVQYNNDVPKEYELLQNYPNPFNPTTTLSFAVPAKSFVSLKVFDTIGREIATIVSEELPPGYYNKVWNANRIAGGVYFYRMRSDNFVETRKLIILK